MQNDRERFSLRMRVLRGAYSSGFTLFELLLVVVVLAISAAIFVPAIGDNLRSSRLRTAANVLAADVEFCASECISRPGSPRAIQFNITNNTYTMIDLNAGTTISYPGDSLPYVNDFATGRNEQLSGVTITSVTTGGVAATLLTFDAYGKPLITSTLTITLSYKGTTMTVSVATVTGDVSITDAGKAASLDGSDNPII